MENFFDVATENDLVGYYCAEKETLADHEDEIASDREEAQANADFNLSLMAWRAMLQGDKKEAEHLVDEIKDSQVRLNVGIDLFELPRRFRS
ncbi:MAG: hypothetical protein LBU39_10330 [Desulfobulbaceae bacterium]|nr:hypothetical protein [Desulfobulbaceae bacterium]